METLIGVLVITVITVIAIKAFKKSKITKSNGTGGGSTNNEDGSSDGDGTEDSKAKE